MFEQIIRSDVRIYAIAEQVALGFCTVRLGKNGAGARLTNVPYAGVVEVGNLVIIDNSTDALLVRAFQQIEEEVILVIYIQYISVKIANVLRSQVVKTRSIYLVCAKSTLTLNQVYKH